MTLAPSSKAVTELEGALRRHVASWPGQGAAAVVFPGRDAVLAGDTLSDFPWASVTKLLTSMASLIALEEGVVSLDDRVGPEESTLRHLLSHASGLPFDGARPVSRPGHRRVYSNTGIEIAARHVERRSGIRFDEYLADAIFVPLGMRRVALVGSPASGAHGSLHDLIALTAQMLVPSLVSAGTWDMATRVSFPGLVGVLPGFGRQEPCDWGLGPEIRATKSPHWTGKGNSPRTFGHFGMSGSFLWVDPDLGLGLCGLSSQPFGAWAKTAWPLLSDEVVSWAREVGCAPAEPPQE